jgi:hypothetical protein
MNSNQVISSVCTRVGNEEERGKEKEEEEEEKS